MNSPPEHLAELAKRDYPLEVDGVHVFTREEIKTLNRFGYWLEALASEKITPFTEEQKSFVSAAKGNKEPETLFENAWVKLVGRRDFESSDVPHYDVYDPKQKWFSDSGRARMRRGNSMQSVFGTGS